MDFDFNLMAGYKIYGVNLCYVAKLIKRVLKHLPFLKSITTLLTEY
jgi:hypothetical protein